MKNNNEKQKKKTIGTFGAASFLNDVGSDMISPIWPLFVINFLGAPLTILGLLDGLGESTVSLSKAGAGYFSDRIKKRKAFIWLGYLFASLSRLGYAISNTWPHLIPFRILDRAGKIRDAPRDAIVADISTKKELGRNFGFINALDNLGAVLGITLSIFLFGVLGYKNLFLLASIPSVIAVLLILFNVKEKHNKSKLHKGITFKDISSNLKLLFILSTVFAIGAFSYSFLLIYANKFGFAVTTIPILYLIFTAVASLTTFQFGKLSDKIGRKKVLMLSFALWSIVCLSFIIFQSFFTIILAFVIYGLHKGSIDPVQKSFVSELAKKKFRASTLGGFQMLIGLAALPASLAAGILADKIHIFAPFYLSLGLTLISLLLLMFVKEK